LRVENTDDYLLTGNTLPISVVSSSGTIAYTMKLSSLPKNAVDARVVTFNQMRYLLVVTVARYAGETANIMVYNINRGKNIVEALGYFEGSDDKSAVFDYVLSTGVNSAPASQTGFAIKKDTQGKDEK